MSDVQLERSVLESKERDELFAIALALGSAPGPRTKKADLVSQILQATGVEEATADKPRRPRPARGASSEAADGKVEAERLEPGRDNGAGALAGISDAGPEAGGPGPTRAVAVPSAQPVGPIGSTAPDAGEGPSTYQRSDGRARFDGEPGLGNNRRRRRRNRDK
ncbi:MAG TPA: hypothetical protein VED59_03545, partial [Acidimicrobiales bacterium]|nr:hypothetical protein [Acidimicrobiales bacterium]